MHTAETGICDECGSSFLLAASRLKGLCPECAAVLYGYENCSHVFRNGTCIRCLWDGSRSTYVRALLAERDAKNQTKTEGSPCMS